MVAFGFVWDAYACGEGVENGEDADGYGDDGDAWCGRNLNVTGFVVMVDATK